MSPDINEQIDRLFQQTGLGDEVIISNNPTLTWLRRAHFRHVLFSAPTQFLNQTFRSMRETLARISSSVDDAQVMELERQLCPLVDRLTREIQASAQRSGLPLPYTNLDWLWLRIAFATATYAAMEGSQPVMLNLMVLKVALMIEGKGGLARLESFITSNGYECSPGELSKPF